MHINENPVFAALALADAPLKSNQRLQAEARIKPHCHGKESAEVAALRILAAALRSRAPAEHPAPQ